MVDEKEIKKLADLSRIEVSPEEMDGFKRDIGSILEYIGQIKEITYDEEVSGDGLKNVLREDINPHQSGEFSEELLAEAPKKEGNYFKVKKILSGDSGFEI